jgi:uncharacterized membrane protein SirB2
MTEQTYRFLHICGLVLLMLGFGAILFAKDGERPRAGTILHGIGLLVMLVAGFGVMAKTHIMAPDSWPGWLVTKMVVWLLIGALPTLLRAGVVPRKLGWLVVLALAASAAWLGVNKGFSA